MSGKAGWEALAMVGMPAGPVCADAGWEVSIMSGAGSRAALNTLVLPCGWVGVRGR